jgi:hypothetical protein
MLLPTLLVAAFLVRRVINDDRLAVEHRLLDAARADAAMIDTELEGTIRGLQGLAQSDHLTDGDIPAFYVQAKRLVTTQPTWAAVSLIAPDGDQILNTTVPFGSVLPLVTDRRSFDRALRKMPAIGALRAGRVSGQLGFSVRVPVIRNDRVAYVISAWITSSNFAHVLRRQASLSNEWVRGVVDTDGVVVARSREPERFVGRKGTPGFFRRFEAADEGVYRDKALDGTTVYGAFSRAPLSRWFGGVAVPA